MNNKKTNNKTKTLWALSMPFLFLAIANNIVPIINTLALALVPNDGVVYSESVGVANIIYSIFGIFTTFAVGGVGVVIGQCIGSNCHKQELKQAINTCLLITLLFSMATFMISEIFSPFILLGFLQSGTEQYHNAIVYIESMYVLIIFGPIRCAMCATMNNHGYVKYTIGLNVFSIILDAGLTFAFVLGADIGVLGSSLGSIIATLISALLAFIFFNKLIMKFKWKELMINKQYAKMLLKISLPVGAEKLSYNFAMFLVGLLVAQLGNKFSDTFIIINGSSRTNLLNLSYTIVQTFGNIVTIASIAFGSGASIICSWKMGAKQYDATRTIIRKAFTVAIICDAILAIILFLLRNHMLMFFELTNPLIGQHLDQIKMITYVPFLLLIFLQLGRTTNIIYLTGPMSYGNLFANVIFSIINTWIIVLGLGSITYFLSSDNHNAILYGINGVYIMMTIDEILRGIFNFLWWKSNRWSIKHSWFMVKDINGKTHFKKNHSLR